MPSYVTGDLETIIAACWGLGMRSRSRQLWTVRTLTPNNLAASASPMVVRKSTRFMP